MFIFQRVALSISGGIMLSLLASVLTPATVIAQELPVIHFFYSDSCSHCQAEQNFLDTLQTKYPTLDIQRYNIADPNTAGLLQTFTESTSSQQYRGVVPLTFIGNSIIVGFDTADTTGVRIEQLLTGSEATTVTETETCSTEIETCIVDTRQDGTNINYGVLDQSKSLQLFGIKAENISLPLLAVLLGTLDGFNICSLGALLLILSLVFTLRSRKKTVLFGLLFLLITGVTYAALIFIWLYVFDVLSPFVKTFELIIAILGLFGGIYFIRQYIRFRKYGPMCEMNESPLITKVTQKLHQVFAEQKGIILTSAAVALFAFAVTVIEFPCSAVIPVAFAAIVTEAGQGLWFEIIHVGIFMLFYLLDEIIIFLIGVWTMRLVVGGQKISKHLALIQGIVFIGLGVFYLSRLW